jgi:biopolymer transport protein ExbD
MGMGGGGGSGKIKSEINVTPLVDVVLVLLIIFLVAMPVVMKEITIDVPKKTDEPPENIVVPDQIVLEMKKSEAQAGFVIQMNGNVVDRVDLGTKLHDKLEHKRDKVVFVGFDDDVPYGEAVQIMDVAKGAGAKTIAIKMKDEAAAVTPGAPAPGAPPAP